MRNGVAGILILATFGGIGAVFALEAPPFAGQFHDLVPRVDAVISRLLPMVGVQPISLEDLTAGVDPALLLTRVFAAARMVISYGVLVIILASASSLPPAPPSRARSTGSMTARASGAAPGG